MSYVYDASAIEVLSGLEPVRKRPGMFTDTSRPNHLAQEVIDNSVDEAIAGYARTIEVTLYQDGSTSARRCVFGLIPRISRPPSLPSHGCVIFCVPRPFSVQGYGCASAMKTPGNTWSGAIRRGSRPISSKPCRTSLCSLKSLLW